MVGSGSSMKFQRSILHLVRSERWEDCSQERAALAFKDGWNYDDMIAFRPKSNDREDERHSKTHS